MKEEERRGATECFNVIKHDTPSAASLLIQFGAFSAPPPPLLFIFLFFLVGKEGTMPLLLSVTSCRNVLLLIFLSWIAEGSGAPLDGVTVCVCAVEHGGEGWSVAARPVLLRRAPE